MDPELPGIPGPLPGILHRCLQGQKTSDLRSIESPQSQTPEVRNPQPLRKGELCAPAALRSATALASSYVVPPATNTTTSFGRDGCAPCCPAAAPTYAKNNRTPLNHLKKPRQTPGCQNSARVPIIARKHMAESIRNSG